jgi:hypothetical protein
MLVLGEEALERVDLVVPELAVVVEHASCLPEGI